MRVYIQSKAGRPYNISATIAAYGFTQRGYELIPFVIDQIDSVDFNRSDVVVGGVGTYQRLFKKLGIDWQGLSYPEELSGFLGRGVHNITLAELSSLIETRPLFVKPAHDNKSFTGFVCKDRWDPRLAGLSGDTPLIWSDVVNFKTEYRVYVLAGKIQNVSRYYGSADLFPDARRIRDMIQTYRSAPVAYSLDVGIEANGRTLLVEVNEGLALGNYGLPPTLHAKMIASRWHEIMGNTIRVEEESQTVDSPAFLNQV